MKLSLQTVTLFENIYNSEECRMCRCGIFCGKRILLVLRTKMRTQKQIYTDQENLATTPESSSVATEHADTMRNFLRRDSDHI